MDVVSCFSRTRHTFVISLILFLSTLTAEAQSQCDPTKGCYTPLFDILENISNFPARTVYASSVCGQNTNTSEQYKSVIRTDLETYTCDPTVIQPMNAVDEDADPPTTYWQSNKMLESDGGTPTAQYIVFNFTDDFIFNEIFIKFMATHVQDIRNSGDARPAAFSIEKVDTATQQWTALHHMAQNCSILLPGIPVFDPYSNVKDPMIVYCEEYLPLDPSADFHDNNNLVEYSPGFYFDTYDDQFKNNMAAISRFTASAVRLHFTQPPSLRSLASYIAISDVIIDVQCKCFGHANSCGGPNNATCNCEHNTQGTHCEECLPLYNDRNWLPGTTADAGICQECNCNGQATSCEYDSAKSHGVCNNCTDNTSGDSCSSCVTGYYINALYSNNTSATNSSINVVRPNYCLPCDCNQNGTQSTALSTCEVSSGQCLCKERVTERDCSQCQDTFWGLASDNLQGCNVCNCNSSGSLGSTNLCSKDTGECLCKDNVEGTTCDTCKPFTFGFSAANPAGCTPCDCDPGASTERTCDVFSGQCTCYTSIGGRDCRTPNSGFYVPRLDAFLVEPESTETENVELRSGHGTVNATVSGRGLVNLASASQIQMTFTSTLSGQMNAVLRFEKAGQDNLVNVQGTLTLASEGGYTCNQVTVQPGQTWSLEFSGVRDEARGGVMLGATCLNAGSSYRISISNSANSAILVDSVAFVLETAPALPVLMERMDISNITACTESVISDIRSTRTECASIEYSLAATILKQAIACSCSGGAQSGTGCDKYSGDCMCLPGALTPSCTQCMADHYQFVPEQGCIDCDCHPQGSTVDHCDDQGNCTCLPNVQGDKCDSCIAEHYGLHTGRGCVTCECSEMYSIDNNCNDFGECNCQPGVQGPLCGGCRDGFYNLTTSGCTACACDPDGSTPKACNVQTGNCECLARTEGSTCDTCKPGFFGLGKWHPEGCLTCFCWAHGKTCVSAAGWYDAPISSSWPLSDPNALAEVWAAQDASGAELTAQTPMVDSGGTQQYAMRIDEAQRGSLDIFYIAPDKFLGDRRASYGRYLTIVLKPSPSSAPGTNSTNSADESSGDVMLEGTLIDVNLVYVYTGGINQTANSDMTMKIPLLEDAWKAVVTDIDNNVTTTTVDNATSTQLQQVLHGLSALKIRAYKANLPSSAVDLLSVSLDNGVDGSINTDHSGIVVNDVEMCSCDPGYKGSSCEECGKDYTRAIVNATHPSSQCMPCACNGHGITQCDEFASDCSENGVTSCDPLTGICNCQHNTMGDHCEFCEPGYYGDPLKGTADDCLPCECPGLIVANDTNVFATTCSLNGSVPICSDCKEGHAGNQCELCVDGYFGTPENATNFDGACRPCECNGRADTCDTRSGECIDCRNNTAGQNCEICAPGYFGDAMNSVCQECSCDLLPGSTGQCDHVTGVCECLPNVMGAECDVCTDEHFNLTAGVGCEPCFCNMTGSTSTVCNKISGQCDCRNLVMGRQCNYCQDSYWNVNSETGCDDCSCNTEGTEVVNGTALTTCDVITGQCTCALPGIVGRTCDECSPVSKYTFDYVSLFYIGSYPDCVLCGECFDSWGSAIEEVGQELHEMDRAVVGVWKNYDNQTAAEVSTGLDVIEEQINRTVQSIDNVEIVANQLQDLQRQYTEALSRQSAISNEIALLTQTEQTLSASLDSLMALTDVVQLTNTTMTSLATLRQQLDSLTASIESSVVQGNTSWGRIQTLAFVVADPEDKEREIRAQAQRLMDIATRVNQTITLTKNLYEATLFPGTEEKVLEIGTANSTINNITVTLAEVNSIIASVENDITASSVSLTTLVEESSTARQTLLDTISSLQLYVTNASIAHKAAEKLFTDATNFKEVAEKAAETIMESMTSLLELIASLEQADADLVKALSQSTAILAIQIPPVESMQALVQQIANTNVSSADVESLRTEAQESVFIADKSVRDAQEALTMSRDLNEEVQLMQADIAASRDLRTRAQGLGFDSNNLNTSIHAVLTQASAHSDSVDGDIAAVTQAAQETQAEITNVTSCLAQRQLDATNAENSATQANENAQATSTAQLALLEVMLQVNSEGGEGTAAEALTNLAQADSAMRDMENGLAQLQAFAEMETLVQDLRDQDEELTALEQEVDQLMSELDSALLLLQESEGGGTTCTET